jgi:hypothetical protein
LRKLFLCPLLMLIVSCSGVPKSGEQGAVSAEQLAESNEQAPTELAITMSEDINQPEPVSEEFEFAKAVAEEEPLAEDGGMLFALDEPEPASPLESAYPPELVSPLETASVVMETLRPLEQGAGDSEQLAGRGESAPEAAPELPAVPEQRTARTVPLVRESWRQPESPKETPAITQEPASPLEMPPAVYDQPEERLLQPDYPVTFSRVARATVGQLVEIPFSGRDWVFLGEVGARRGIAYDSRKMDSEGESFIFRVDAAGVYTLKFYRQDFARDFILNDHVQIIAGSAPQTTGLAWFNPPIDRSRVIAGPRWPNFLESPPLAVQPEAPAATVTPSAETVRPAAPPTAAASTATAPARQPSAARNETVRPQGLSGDAVAQASPEQAPSSPKETPPPPVPAPEPKSPDSILKEAREEFNAGRIASAITLLDQFRKFFPSGSDEAWWLYGQCYEANSPNRNILAALDYYRRIVREYPQSSRLSDARRRISYLERYYINIQ